jgi:hypothetical protein
VNIIDILNIIKEAGRQNIAEIIDCGKKKKGKLQQRIVDCSRL